jgi:gentisate 1,2-dioxygenase
MSCEFSLLRPREETGSHRHNSTVVYHVFRGEGATAVGEERLEWVEGDIFVIPPWEWHRHENRRDQDSILFSIADWPALDALGLYREEHKAVSGEQ